MEAKLKTEVTSRPYERIAIDITEMPLSARGNKYALVLMDYFSKYVHVFPMANQDDRKCGRLPDEADLGARGARETAL